MFEKRIGLRDSLLISFIKCPPSNNGILKYIAAGSVTLLYRWLPFLLVPSCSAFERERKK